MYKSYYLKLEICERNSILTAFRIVKQVKGLHQSVFPVSYFSLQSIPIKIEILSFPAVYIYTKNNTLPFYIYGTDYNSSSMLKFIKSNIMKEFKSTNIEGVVVCLINDTSIDILANKSVLLIPNQFVLPVFSKIIRVCQKSSIQPLVELCENKSNIVYL